jgi:hypothetical protein
MPFFLKQNADQDIIEAIQWFPGQYIDGVGHEALEQVGGGGLLPSPPHARLTTAKGWFTVFMGDWIITEVTGEQRVCQDGLFQLGYLPVDSEFILQLGIAPSEQVQPSQNGDLNGQ